MEISVRSNIKEFTRGVNDLVKRQVPFAASKTINTIAYELSKQEFVSEMDSQLDKPTRFTRQAFVYQQSTKRNLTSIVRAKQIQKSYLHWQVDGGHRAPKNRAIPIPVGQKRNAYGNMPKGAVKRLAGNKKTFSGIPRGRKTPGIYQRTGKKGRGGLKLMVKWQPEGANYHKRIDFLSVAERVVRARFPRLMSANLAAAIRTAR